MVSLNVIETETWVLSLIDGPHREIQFAEGYKNAEHTFMLKKQLKLLSFRVKSAAAKIRGKKIQRARELKEVVDSFTYRSVTEHRKCSMQGAISFTESRLSR